MVANNKLVKGRKYFENNGKKAMGKERKNKQDKKKSSL